jgi:hypothetical protein
MVVERHRVVEEGSWVTAVLRPTFDGRSLLEATITGEVTATGPAGADGSAPAIDGVVTIALREPPVALELDVATTEPELERTPDGGLFLRGTATRPAAVIGAALPPLLNPTILLRWRATLVPDD